MKTGCQKSLKATIEVGQRVDASPRSFQVGDKERVKPAGECFVF